jgi:hypothetical protein
MVAIFKRRDNNQKFQQVLRRHLIVVRNSNCPRHGRAGLSTFLPDMILQQDRYGWQQAFRDDVRYFA